MWTKIFLPIILFHAYTVISFPNEVPTSNSQGNGNSEKSEQIMSERVEDLQRSNSRARKVRTVINKNCTCGQHFGEIKIVNGKPTQVNEYTWMAALIKIGETHPFCGGSLINNRYVLTAAHCVESVRAHQMVVKLLEHDTSNPDETKVVTAHVSKIIKHPEYTYFFDYDIALLRLKDPVTLTEGDSKDPKLVNICLPTSPIYANEMWEEKNVRVAGWGKVETDGSVSPILQHANLTIEKDATCKSNFPPDDITPRMMCARGLPTDSSLKVTDSCSGDSGGPLMFLSPGGLFFQVGIVSWGTHEGCGNQVAPGVYTRVSEMMSWINQHTQDGEECMEPVPKGNN